MLLICYHLIHFQNSEDISDASEILETIQHVASKYVPLRNEDFSVNAECLLIYGFQGFFNNSLSFVCRLTELLGS